MTLRDLYLRNDNINLLDDVVLKVEGQILQGKLYQFDKYFNLHVVCVGGLGGCVYYLSDSERGSKSFKEFLLLYSNNYFLNGEIDVYYNGRFLTRFPY